MRLPSGKEKARNTANRAICVSLRMTWRCRPAGERSHQIQSYTLDIRDGKTVMMREIDVPIRGKGCH